MTDDEYDTLRSSWGFPGFARDFPRHETLDALVAAFARGDYATVNADGAKLASATEDAAIRDAVATLRAHTKPDPTSRIFFALAGALLVFLTAWWLVHDGPPKDSPPVIKPTPTVEKID